MEKILIYSSKCFAKPETKDLEIKQCSMAKTGKLSTVFSFLLVIENITQHNVWQKVGYMRKLMAMATNNKSWASILKSNPKKTLFKNVVKQTLNT